MWNERCVLPATSLRWLACVRGVGAPRKQIMTATQPARGCATFTADLRRREYVIGVLATSMSDTFEPLETPGRQDSRPLLGRYGAEAQAISDPKARAHETSVIELRCYDLTVPLARAVADTGRASNFSTLSVQPSGVDRPAPGASRVLQVNVDVLGSTSLMWKWILLDRPGESARLNFSDFLSTQPSSLWAVVGGVGPPTGPTCTSAVALKVGQDWDRRCGTISRKGLLSRRLARGLRGRYVEHGLPTSFTAVV